MNIVIDIVSGSLIAGVICSAVSWIAVQLSKKMNKELFTEAMKSYDLQLIYIRNSLDEIKAEVKNHRN